MQELSKETLIKSLSFNIFYPRDFSDFTEELINFSYELNDNSQAFISSNFDELGYARRYSKKRLFYKANKLCEDTLIKSSIYGADGIIIYKNEDAKLLDLAKNCGLMLAFYAKNNFDLFKGAFQKADIFITPEKLLKNIPENKLKGIICSI